MAYKFQKGPAILTGSITGSSIISAGDYYYESDSGKNTYVDFGEDSVGLVAGGVDFLKATETTQNILVINEAGSDVDFRVESSGEDEAIFLNAGNNTLHINKGSSAFSTSIYGNSGNALEVNSSGVTINEAGAAANDFRVESDDRQYMFFVDAGNNRVGVGSHAPSASFHISGSQAGNYTGVTANLTLTETHHIVDLTTNNTRTITLPAASGITGRIYHILSTGDGDAVLTVASAGGQFMGSSQESGPENSIGISGSAQSVSVVSTGTYWFILTDNRQQHEG